MGDLKESFKIKADAVGVEIKALLKEHGDKKIGEVTLSQIYQGMRGITGLVSETSLLDAQEGIRFRGHTIPELRESLPKAKDGFNCRAGTAKASPFKIFLLEIDMIIDFIVFN